MSSARNTAPGKPAVIGSGGDIKTLGADVSAEGAVGDRQDRAIAQYLGVPAWVVNVAHAAGSLVYQNAGAAGLDLVRYNLQPGYSGPIGDAWSRVPPRWLPDRAARPHRPGTSHPRHAAGAGTDVPDCDRCESLDAAVRGPQRSV